MSIATNIAALTANVAWLNTNQNLIQFYDMPELIGVLSSSITNIEDALEALPDSVTIDGGTVTQASSITTGVILNAPKGVITTVLATTAGLAASTFTVTNSYAAATSNISAYIVDYAGTIITAGVPSVIVDNRTAGTFDVIIYNAHATNALNGILQIGFVIN